MDDERALRMERADRAMRARSFVQSDGLMPLTPRPRGRFNNRFRPGETRILITNDLGRPVECSPTQSAVYSLVVASTGPVTMRAIAEQLKVAPSTVSRAMTMLAAFRLLAYDVVRGRNGGVKVLSLAWADLKVRARKAHARIAHEKDMVAKRWLNKLERTGYYWSGLNVALTTDVERNIYRNELRW